jgi:hypothetical protein
MSKRMIEISLIGIFTFLIFLTAQVFSNSNRLSHYKQAQVTEPVQVEHREHTLECREKNMGLERPVYICWDTP